ncbi:MAG TPA: PAS domain S-box protein, partial [Gemmatimonadaceae bacterium]|nr:PAS domain S-box protein [Gemmatimonadaceae bacterium]
LVSRVPGSDASFVIVIEPEESSTAIGLERFEPDDIVRAVGVLARRAGAPGVPASYYLLPRSADDVTPIGWPRGVQRRVEYSILGLTALLLLIGAAVAARRELFAARARTDAVLRESESRYRLLVEEAPVGILVHRRGRVLFVNSAFTALFGMSEEMALGSRLIDLIHSSDRPRVIAWIRALRNRRQRAVRARERFKRLDGRMIDIEIAATPMLFRGQAAVQVVVHDVTSHALLEEQLRHSQKMEAIGQLAAGVAHDFNNILTTIAGYSQLILDDYPLNEDLRKDVEEIQRAGERASTLTKQLLAVSRRQLVLAEVVDLNDVITSAEHLFNRTIGAQIALDVALAPDACPVFADRGQLEHVIMNLVLNARDAMPDGGLLQVETRAIVVAEDADANVGIEPGEYIALIVRDSGIGMSPETQQRIFDPFFTTKPVGDGSGLGLATMYGIVTGAHGRVSVRSTEGAGSEFTVLLPRVQSAPEARKGNADAPALRGDGARVLLIEDETAVRTAARRILERNGYEVLEARNGADALLLWHEDGPTFACVVSDVVLPGMRGPELVGRFRADRASLPVLFVSGYTDHTLGHLDLAVPNTAFLQKPFEPKQLATALSELLRGSALAA